MAPISISLYLNKQKIQNLINQQRRNLADVDYINLDLIYNIIQNFENASGDLSDGADKSDVSDELRFSLADYDEQTQDDIIAILRPFVRQNIDMEPERYIAYLKEKNVNIPNEEAAVNW